MNQLTYVCIFVLFFLKLSSSVEGEQIEFDNYTELVRKKLDAKEIEDISLLRESVIKANAGFDVDKSTTINDSVLKKGIAYMMKQELGTVVKGDLGRKVFEKRLENIEDGCHKVFVEFRRPSLKVFDAIREDNTLIHRLSKENLIWVTNSRICTKIVSDQDEIFDASFKELVKSKRLRKMLDHLSSSFKKE